MVCDMNIPRHSVTILKRTVTVPAPVVSKTTSASGNFHFNLIKEYSLYMYHCTYKKRAKCR